jgi:hypothetical protein
MDIFLETKFLKKGSLKSLVDGTKFLLRKTLKTSIIHLIYPIVSLTRLNPSNNSTSLDSIHHSQFLAYTPFGVMR